MKTGDSWCVVLLSSYGSTQHSSFFTLPLCHLPLLHVFTVLESVLEAADTERDTLLSVRPSVLYSKVLHNKNLFLQIKPSLSKIIQHALAVFKLSAEQRWDL